MASLERAPTAIRHSRQRVCDDSGSPGRGGGGNADTLHLRRQAERRMPRSRVGSYGAILLMTTLVQRSMAAGSFFKVCEKVG